MRVSEYLELEDDGELLPVPATPGSLDGARAPTRACPVDHGTGSRSQILMDATSMVPRQMKSRLS